MKAEFAGDDDKEERKLFVKVSIKSPVLYSCDSKAVWDDSGELVNARIRTDRCSRMQSGKQFNLFKTAMITLVRGVCRHAMSPSIRLECSRKRRRSRLLNLLLMKLTSPGFRRRNSLIAVFAVHDSVVLHVWWYSIQRGTQRIQQQTEM